MLQKELIIDEENYIIALLAYDAEKKWTVVSFRATVCGDDWQDVKIDLNYMLVPNRNYGCKNKGCKAHQGFFNSTERLFQKEKLS